MPPQIQKRDWFHMLDVNRPTCAQSLLVCGDVLGHAQRKVRVLLQGDVGACCDLSSGIPAVDKWKVPAKTILFSAKTAGCQSSLENCARTYRYVVPRP